MSIEPGNALKPKLNGFLSLPSGSESASGTVTFSPTSRISHES